MISLHENALNWWDLWIAALVLFLFWVLANLLERWLALGRFGGGGFGRAFRKMLGNALRKIRILYSLLTFLILVSIFVWINPLIHGGAVLLVVLAGFPVVRNFVNGRLLLLNEDFYEAEVVRNKVGEGAVASHGLLGLHLKNREGVLHLPYYQLATREFVLKKPGGSLLECNLELTPGEEILVTAAKMPGFLMHVPFTDASRLPAINPLPDGRLEVKLWLKESSYLAYLKGVLEESGWQVLEKPNH